MDGGATDIVGLLSGTDGVDGNTECLQRLKGNHGLQEHEMNY